MENNMEMEKEVRAAISGLTSASGSVLYSALIMIRTTLIKSRKALNLMVQLDAVKLLVHLLGDRQRHINQTKMTDIVMSILANLCLEEDVRQKVVLCDGLEVIAQVTMAAEQESIQNRGVRAVANLALDESNCNKIFALQFPAFVATRLMETDDAECQSTYCRALQLFGQTGNTAKKLMEDSQAILALAALLKLDNRKLALKSLRILSELSSLRCCSSFTSQVLAANVLEDLIMFAEDENISFASNSINIVLRLCEQEIMRPALGSAGLISLLVKLMKSERMFINKILTLNALCLCSKEAVNRNKIYEAGGLEMFIEALKVDEVDQGNSFSVLYDRIISSLVNFLYNDDCFGKLLDLGLVKVLIKHLSRVCSFTPLEVDLKQEIDGLVVDERLQVAGEKEADKPEKCESGVLVPTKECGLVDEVHPSCSTAHQTPQINIGEESRNDEKTPSDLSKSCQDKDLEKGDAKTNNPSLSRDVHISESGSKLNTACDSQDEESEMEDLELEKIMSSEKALQQSSQSRHTFSINSPTYQMEAARRLEDYTSGVTCKSFCEEHDVHRLTAQTLSSYSQSPYSPLSGVASYYSPSHPSPSHSILVSPSQSPNPGSPVPSSYMGSPGWSFSGPQQLISPSAGNLLFSPTSRERSSPLLISYQDQLSPLSHELTSSPLHLFYEVNSGSPELSNSQTSLFGQAFILSGSERASGNASLVAESSLLGSLDHLKVSTSRVNLVGASLSQHSSVNENVYSASEDEDDENEDEAGGNKDVEEISCIPAAHSSLMSVDNDTSHLKDKITDSFHDNQNLSFSNGHRKRPREADDFEVFSNSCGEDVSIQEEEVVCSKQICLTPHPFFPKDENLKHAFQCSQELFPAKDMTLEMPLIPIPSEDMKVDHHVIKPTSYGDQDNMDCESVNSCSGLQQPDKSLQAGSAGCSHSNSHLQEAFLPAASPLVRSPNFRSSPTTVVSSSASQGKLSRMPENMKSLSKHAGMNVAKTMSTTSFVDTVPAIVEIPSRSRFRSPATTDANLNQDEQVNKPMSREKGPPKSIYGKSLLTESPKNESSSGRSNETSNQQDRQSRVKKILRTTEINILILLARTSVRINPSQFLTDASVICSLLGYIQSAPNPLRRSCRIVHRICSNPHCFEKLLVMQLPVMLVKSLVLESDGSFPHDLFSACDSSRNLNDLIPSSQGSDCGGSQASELGRRIDFEFGGDAYSTMTSRTHSSLAELFQSSSRVDAEARNSFLNGDDEIYSANSSRAECRVRVGLGLLQSLGAIAMSKFGDGEIQHLMLRRPAKEKLRCLISMLHLKVGWCHATRHQFFTKYALWETLLPHLFRWEAPLVRESIVAAMSLSLHLDNPPKLTPKVLDLTSCPNLKDSSKRLQSQDCHRAAFPGQVSHSPAGKLMNSKKTLSLQNLGQSKASPRCPENLEESSVTNDSVIDKVLSCHDEKADSALSCLYQAAHKRHDICFLIKHNSLVSKIGAHRETLMKKSEVFAAMFSGSYAESRQSEISIADINKEAFAFVIHYLHGCSSECPVIHFLSDKMLHVESRHGSSVERLDAGSSAKSCSRILSADPDFVHSHDSLDSLTLEDKPHVKQTAENTTDSKKTNNTTDSKNTDNTTESKMTDNITESKKGERLGGNSGNVSEVDPDDSASNHLKKVTELIRRCESILSLADRFLLHELSRYPASVLSHLCLQPQTVEEIFHLACLYNLDRLAYDCIRETLMSKLPCAHTADLFADLAAGGYREQLYTALTWLLDESLLK